MVIDSFNMPVSMIRQYCFCPRIPFFYIARQLMPIAGTWVEQGIKFHEKTEMLQKRRNLSKLGITDKFSLENEINLNSDSLHMHGVCDSIIKTQNEIFPLEFKMQEHLLQHEGSELQLCAYAMLLEEQFCIDIQYGFILYGSKGKFRQVIFSKDKRDKIKSIISSIFRDCSGGFLPATASTEKQCSQCEFLNFCADRL